MKQATAQTLNNFIAYIKQWYPKINVATKQSSVLMRIIGVIVYPFNPNFMTGFVTTIGNTIYVPEQFLTDSQAKNTLITLAHETMHVVDFNVNPFKFVLSYLFPMPLVLLGLIAGIFFHWAFILSAIALAPIPAYWRMLWELHGFRMTLTALYWSSSKILDTDITEISSCFTGPTYYFMWPFKNDINARLTQAKTDVLNNSILNEPLILSIQKFYLQNNLMNDNLRKSVNIIYQTEKFNFDKR